ncbi:MAG: hypothetical protein A4E71_01242 [Smithella sp. PtaU1.Bin162]|nr:MAG: hypothetical protein A4E71_01242 [Smithella sp. PtaU1.Bin162]
MATEAQDWLSNLIRDFVLTSPLNSLRREPDEKAWDEPLVGFSSGADPLYKDFKDAVGEDHWTPLEAFSLKFPGTVVRPENLTVISWILPHRQTTKDDTSKENFYPSLRWVQARFPGEEFNNSLRRYVVEELNKKGILSVVPLHLPEWSWGKSVKYVYSSKWSERHAAYASGLGTFGLCDGLITNKGKAHRAGSVIANIAVPATARPYADHRAYCLFFFDKSCTACGKRCPVGAVTEKGHDKLKCWDHAGGTCARYVKENFGFDGYGCGLCQTGVPCASGIPRKILQHLEKAQAG